MPGDVSPWDIRFDPSDARHLYKTGSDRVRVNIWTEPELVEGFLVLRAGGVELHPLSFITGDRFRFWSAELAIDQPAEFALAFRTENGAPVYRVPSGVTNAIERLDRWSLDPEAIPLVETPDWAAGAIIYQIFPERFANGDPGLNPEATANWEAEPAARQFQGGDLIGVRDRLDYLQGLGVDALYLNPVFASPSTHKYDTVDYYQVDPAFGGNQALGNLIEAAHARDLKVILDASFNHVHPRFFAFQDLIGKGAQSEYRHWFRVRDWPLRVTYRPGAKAPAWVKRWLPVWEEEVGLPIERSDDIGPSLETSYDSWYSVPTMPRVNLSDPGARGYFLDVATYWVKEFGIDGWRMDVARYVDPDFWDDFRAVVKAVKPDAYLVSEIFGDSGPWLQGDRFDATMNYTFRSICLRFFAADVIDARRMVDDCLRLLAMYPWPVSLVNHNLLGSHDTARFLTAAAGDLWRLRLATVFQLTFPGAAGIYYGDEVGMSGRNDPGCRGTFPWDRLEQKHPVLETITQLSAIRNRRPSLRRGEFVPLLGRGGLLAFERRLGRERSLVAINRSSRPMRLPLPGRVKVRWGDGEIIEGEAVIAGRSAVLFW